MQPGATSIPSNPVAPKPIVKELYQFNYLGTYYSSCNYWSDKTKAEAKAEEKFTAPFGEDGRRKIVDPSPLNYDGQVENEIGSDFVKCKSPDGNRGATCQLLLVT